MELKLSKMILNTTKRRVWLKSQQEQEDDERRAYWHAHVRGPRGLARGEFPVF